MDERRWFRCFACLEDQGVYTDFFAELPDPECPKCGAHAPAVITLMLTHYMARHPQGPFGSPGNPKRYALACRPTETNLTKLRVNGENASNHVPIVNCPNCQATDIYKAALAALKIDAAKRSEIVDIKHACC